MVGRVRREGRRRKSSLFLGPGNEAEEEESGEEEEREGGRKEKREGKRQERMVRWCVCNNSDSTFLHAVLQ